MNIRKFIIAPLFLLALTRAGFSDNLETAKEIRKILNDKLVQILLKETFDATGGDHLVFKGIVYSKDQFRDAKHRYDLRFRGESGKECALIVKYRFPTNELEAFTKEEVEEALLPCVSR